MATWVEEEKKAHNLYRRYTLLKIVATRSGRMTVTVAHRLRRVQSLQALVLPDIKVILPVGPVDGATSDRADN